MYHDNSIALKQFCWQHFYNELSIFFSFSCLKLAVVHDLAECIVGDITPRDPMGKDEKHRREKVRSSWPCVYFVPNTVIRE